MSKPAFRDSVEWWRRLFLNPPPRLKLPFSRPRPLRHANPEDGIVKWGLHRATSERLDRIAREEGATSYVIRLAALVALLAEGAGHSDVILGTYVTTRNCVESQNLFGFFSNLVTLRFQCELAETFRKWVVEVGNRVANTQANGGIPYEILCDELRKQKILPPDIDLIMGASNARSPVYFDDLELTWLERRYESMPWGVTVAFDVQNEQKGCGTIFDARLHDPVRVRAWTARFLRLLELAAESPDFTLEKLLHSSSG